jgi:hypothetical protein
MYKINEKGDVKSTTMDEKLTNGTLKPDIFELYDALLHLQLEVAKIRSENV